MAEEIGIRDEILKLLDREPFSPFTIRIVSGDKYEVSNPRQVAITESVIIVAPKRQTHSFFPIYQISAVDVHEPAL